VSDIRRACVGEVHGGTNEDETVSTLCVQGGVEEKKRGVIEMHKERKSVRGGVL